MQISKFPTLGHFGGNYLPEKTPCLYGYRKFSEQIHIANSFDNNQ